MRFLLISIFVTFPIFSQDATDVSNIRNNLTSDQIAALNSELSNENAEIYDDSNELNFEENEENEENKATTLPNYGNKFGYQYFINSRTNADTGSDLPVPNDYKITLGDSFTIILSGAKDRVFNVSVKLDGSIMIPEVGSIYVYGMTFKEAKESISSYIVNFFAGVNVDIALRGLSAKKVSIVGAVNRPGSYLVNPYTTLSSVLSYAGGAQSFGSLRNIVIRKSDGSKTSYDLYKLLVDGNRTVDVTLDAGDTVLVNGSVNFVEISGEVIRPAIYEYVEGETVKDIVTFALGFTGNANISQISTTKVNLVSKNIINENIESLDQAIEGLSKIEVFPLGVGSNLDISVTGPVSEPGNYDFKLYKDLKTLIDDLSFTNDLYPFLGIVEQFDKVKLKSEQHIFSLKDKTTYENIKLYEGAKVVFLKRDFQSLDSYGLKEDTKKLYLENRLNFVTPIQNVTLPMVGQYYVEELINYLGIDESRIEKERVLLTRAEDLNQVVAYDQPIKMVSNQVVYIFNKSEFSIIGPAKLRGNLPLSKNIKLSEILENLEFDRDLYPFVGLVESFDPDTLSLESKLFNLNQASTQNIEITNFSKVYFFDRSNFRNYSDLGISGNGTQLLNDYALRLNYRGNTINMPVYGNVELSTVLSFLGLDLSDVELGRTTYVMPLKDRTVVKPYNEITLESSKFHSASLRFKNSELITVYINGEANYPGTLTLNKSTTFKDLYSIIGGLSDYAFQDGIILQRESVRQQQIAAVKKAQESLREYLAINQQLGQQTLNADSVEFLTQNINPDLLGRIGGDFSEDSKLIDTFLLEDGDTIFIPRKMNTVTIIGEVLSPNTIVYQKGKRLNKYINMAGGYKDFANKRNTYVIKANGVIEKKKWNLLFQTNSIGPGDVIVVPRDMTIRDNPLESIALITRPLYDLAFSAAALDSIKD